MKDVVAVLMASGHSTRFRPLNWRHKSLVEVGGKPLIRRTLEGLKRSGIKNVVIVHRPQDEGLLRSYISEREATFVRHDPEYIKGSWSVLKVAYEAIKGYDRVLMLAPYHIETQYLLSKLLPLLDSSEAALVLAPKAGGVQYGNAFVRGSRVVRVLEKKRVTSGRKISAIYAFRSSLVERIVEEGESLYDRVGEAVLEFILDELARKQGIPFIEASLPSLKYPRHVLDRLEIIIKRMFERYSDEYELLEGSGKLGGGYFKGRVIVSEDAEIKHGAYLENSIVLGGEIYEYAVVKDSFVKQSIIGTHALVRESSIGSRSVVGAHMEIARSVLICDVHTHSGYIGDSVIDLGSRIGAGTVIANTRLDRNEISVNLCDGRTLNTKRKRLGAILGSEVYVGINASIMPGTIIGSGSVVYPGTLVKGCFPERSVIR